MQQAIETMLTLQNDMNTKVHPEWLRQGYAWYRAVWIECAELMDHIGYKWWKQQAYDIEQVKLEVVDIWHFGLSMLLSAEPEDGRAALIGQITQDLTMASPGVEVGPEAARGATEALALVCLESRSFSVAHFAALLKATDMSFDELFTRYVGKNVLNFFRQDHGYKEGTYQKTWSGREDNAHLAELARALPANAPDYPEQLYAALKTRYESCLAAS